MSVYPGPIQTLVEIFSRFPGIGEKTAQRFAFFLLRQPQDLLIRFAKAILALQDSIRLCAVCQNYTERTPCQICSSPTRDQGIICVVALSHDVTALERTSEFKGVYHVLGGNINILEGVTPDKLKVKELVERLNVPGKVKEVILALNPDLERRS